MLGYEEVDVDTQVLLLPAGFSLPPWPYLVGLLIAVAGVVVTLWRQKPAVTDGVLVGLSVWVVAGGIGHALFQQDLLPDPVAPLFGTAAVYLTGVVLAGTSWILGGKLSRQTPVVLGTAVATGGAGLGYALITGPLGEIGWAVGAVVVSVVVSALTWELLRRRRPAIVEAAGTAGLLVVFGHGVDGVSTAIGYDLLGAGERTPLPAFILNVGGRLPTAEIIGAGWLFVLVKLVLAAGIVVLFRDILTDTPIRGRVLLFLIAAVGLGPGAHNIVLYLIA